MRGHVDPYIQMRIFLSEADVKTLESKGKVAGKITGTRDDSTELDVRLRIHYIPTDSPHPDELPIGKRFQENGGYELYVGPTGLRLIKNKYCAGGGPYSEGNYIRSAFITLEGVIL